ncbi:MAG TPA: hypothetical protein ENH82_14145 [bacterium]|nr:hypothetical protein [bacterium]
MKTRKEIGDRDGYKSLWVIEWLPSHTNKWLLWRHLGYNCRNNAVKYKNELYSEYKLKFPGRTMHFRVALYVRAE